MIARRPDAAIYMQLAEQLRARILDGTYPPGGLFPSESRLMQEHGLARDTVRRAVRELRNEGLVVVEPGRDSRVRRQVEVADVLLPPGTHFEVRMPTSVEAHQHKLATAVPVLVAEIDGRITFYAGDRYRFVAGLDKPQSSTS